MASENPGDNGSTPEVLEWRVHPLTENAWRSVLLVAIILATCYGIFAWTGWGGLALIGLIFLVISMAPFFFPTRYRISDEGIEIVFLAVRTFKSWDEYRNFYPHEMGVHLSTFRRLNYLDSFRGNFIRFAAGNRNEVIRFLDAHIDRKLGVSGTDK